MRSPTCRTDPQFTAAMWYRILLPELLPSVGGRPLPGRRHARTPTRSPPLPETDLSDSYLAAVRQRLPGRTTVAPPEEPRPGRPRRSYFNSGVLLLNLGADALRREAGRRCAPSPVERGGELLRPDQDALNVVLGARRLLAGAALELL